MAGFDDILNELVNTGQLPDDAAQKLRDASPLRKDLETTKSELAAAQERTRTLEQRLSADVFSKVGITLNPSLLRTPDDLDVTDVDAVRKWAVEKQLIEDTPATPPAEMEQHQRVAAAAVDAPLEPGQADLLAQLDPRKMSEDDFWAQAAAMGRTT
jgi:hypothetical protein